MDEASEMWLVYGYLIFLSDGTNACMRIHKDLMVFWPYPALICSDNPQYMFYEGIISEK